MIIHILVTGILLKLHKLISYCTWDADLLVKTTNILRFLNVMQVLVHFNFNNLFMELDQKGSVLESK